MMMEPKCIYQIVDTGIYINVLFSTAFDVSAGSLTLILYDWSVNAQFHII